MTKFILDVHLGKLAKHLRMLGFDALWRDNYSDEEIVRIQEAESRVVLTRDRALLNDARIRSGYLIQSTDPKEQLKEVVAQFDLFAKINPFTVCLECNGRIVEVEKEKVASELGEETRKHFNEFFTCLECRRIYWKGSHYDRMMELVKGLENK